jgi:septin 7
MKRLGHRVNLIPVIAKSDTLTDDEIKAFKGRILEDMAFHNIPYYQPHTNENDDPEIIQENKEVLSKLPFAVVGSDREIQVGKKMVRGRQYPWGVIEVENEEHCDFVKLRHMLIRSHMEELKDYTNNVLYENFRIEKMKDMGPMEGGDGERGLSNMYIIIT